MQADILDALRRGANDEALTLARAAVAAQPDDPQTYRALAMALRASGDNESALTSIDRAIALAPDDADLHFHRAGYLLGESQPEAARAALSQSVQLDPNQFGAYVMQAQLAIARGDLDEAERLARLAARVVPEHPWTLMLEGSIALQRDDADRALALLSQAAEKAPEDTQVRHALGFAYLKKGHLAFAEQAFRRTLEKMPAAPGLRGLIAELLRRQGRPADAAAELAPLLEAADVTPGLQRFAAELELMAGHHERALPLLRGAFAAQPGDPRTTEALLEALRRAGDRDDARNTFEAALATSSQIAKLWQARLAIEVPTDAGALAVAERWLAAMPDALPALEAKLWLLMMREERVASEAVAQRVVEQLPGHRVAEMHLVDRLASRDPAAAVARVEALLSQAQQPEARRELRGWLASAQDRAGRYQDAVAGWSGLHVEAESRSFPLPEPTPAPASWPPLADVAEGSPAVAFLAGAPGSGVERLAHTLGGSLPSFRADRFAGAQAPQDLLQHFRVMAQLAEGELDAADVARSWREHLPARGLTGEVIDWLLWWDNALLNVLRPQLPQATVMIAVRDPRDMLLDWLAFGAPLQLKAVSPTAMAAWLAGHVDQVASLHEQSLFPHALVRMDDIHDDGAGMAHALSEALRSDVAAPPAGVFGPPHFKAGHWRDYAQALAEPFALLAPVARRLGYPEA